MFVMRLTYSLVSLGVRRAQAKGSSKNNITKDKDVQSDQLWAQRRRRKEPRNRPTNLRSSPHESSHNHPSSIKPAMAYMAASLPWLPRRASLTMRRAERTLPTELLVQEARSTLNRFTGGGFNLNMPAS